MDTGTILLAVAGFLAGHYVLKLVLEPAVEARKLIATARTTYDFYRDISMNPPPPQTPAQPPQFDASQALRRAAGDLRVVPSSVLFYDWVRYPFDLPPRDRLELVASRLISLSNNLFGASSIAIESAIHYSDDIREAVGW